MTGSWTHDVGSLILVALLFWLLYLAARVAWFIVIILLFTLGFKER